MATMITEECINCGAAEHVGTVRLRLANRFNVDTRGFGNRIDHRADAVYCRRLHAVERTLCIKVRDDGHIAKYGAGRGVHAEERRLRARGPQRHDNRRRSGRGGASNETCL